MKIGVVGHGSIGSRHAYNLRKLGHEVVVYDPAYMGSVRRETAIYDDPAISGVVIATPSPYHEGPLRACIERRKHVLVEKPISVGIGQLPLLLDVADEKGLIVMVGNNLRFHPAVIKVKSWIETALGGVPLWSVFICAQFNLDYHDSVVLNWGAHEVDLAIHLLGPVKEVLCASVLTDAGIETMADFTLLHQNGVRSSFNLDYVTPQEIRTAMIAGTKQNIFLNLPLRRAGYGGAGGYIEPFSGSYDDDYINEMKTFIQRIEGRTDVPGATGRDGLAVLRTLLDVRKKAGLL